MIKSKLTIWAISFAILLLGILFSSFLISRLLQTTTIYDETSAMLTLQRAAVHQMLLNVRSGGRGQVRFSGELGVASFQARQKVLTERYRLIGAGRDHLVKLQRLGDDLKASLDAYVERADNASELSTVGRLYMSSLDLVEGSLESNRQEDLDYTCIVPVVVLIAGAWLIATGVLYWACFGITYGYDMFMRDLA